MYVKMTKEELLTKVRYMLDRLDECINAWNMFYACLSDNEDAIRQDFPQYKEHIIEMHIADNAEECLTPLLNIEMDLEEEDA